MRARGNPERRWLSLLCCATFLAATLAPCPPPADAGHASAPEHPPGCEMHESADSVKVACPCGCGERAPLAGSSARLGVALPSSAPGFSLVFVAARPPLAHPLLRDSFVSAIDHVPLPA